MYQQIPVSCECGQQPSRLREVGLTADRQLVIYWRCSHCRRHVYIVKPLADCWRDCPIPDSADIESAPASPDSAFLSRLRVAAPNRTA